MHLHNTMKIAALLLCLTMLLPPLASAQEAEAEDFSNLPIPAWGKAILDSFEKPLHPVVGGVASSGGIGVGVAYDSPENQEWFHDAEAMVTHRRYWAFEGEFGRRSLSRRSHVAAFGGVRHMGRLDYFGIGPDTVLSDRAAFRLRETTFGMRGWTRPLPAVRIGGSVAAYMPDLGRTDSPSVRPVEDIFSRSALPGFESEPTFGRYRGFAEFIHPVLDDVDLLDDATRYRGAYQVAFEVVRDHRSGRHNLHRWETEVQQRIPGIRPGQRLTLHGFLSATNSGADVPFYLMYTLGGSGGLKTFRPDMLGGDGSRASMRGFRNFRFRDRNLLLMQAEYRIPVHRYVHTTVFVDAGQVAPRTSKLFTDLRANTGFSVSYVRKGRTLGRMDVGFGGGEGMHVFWSFGALPN